MLEKILVPTMGESINEATVSKWLKHEGDSATIDEPLVELETDKVNIEVPAPATGILDKILVCEGEDVSIGDVLAHFIISAEISTDAVDSTTLDHTKIPVLIDKKVAPKSSPVASKIMMEKSVNPASVIATGAKGHITKSDAQIAAKKAQKNLVSTTEIITATKSEDSSPRPADSREEVVKMSRLRQRIAARLKEAQNTAALLTTFNEIEMDALINLRREYKDKFNDKHKVKLGFMSFFVKACVLALKELPSINAEIYSTDVIYKNYYDIGIAVGSPAGVVVPIIRDADGLGFAAIERQIADYSMKARNGTLELSDITGGTFTITNGGIFGSLLSTPIINPPQTAILGMHKIQKRPVVHDDKIEVANVMYVALSYDHRLIDGREAITFLVRVKEMLEDPARLLIDI